MMRVTSCSASHTSCRNVLGGFGGIVLDPNTSRLHQSGISITHIGPIRDEYCGVHQSQRTLPHTRVWYNQRGVFWPDVFPPIRAHIAYYHTLGRTNQRRVLWLEVCPPITVHITTRLDQSETSIMAKIDQSQLTWSRPSPRPHRPG